MLGKHQLDPKEDTALKIVYDTDGRPGPYEKRIYLITNSLIQPRLIITLKGEILPAPAALMTVEPRKINIGSLQKDAQKDIIFKVSNEGNRPLEITNIYSVTGKSLVFPKKEIKTLIPPEAFLNYEITFKNNTTGPFVEVLLIDSNARNVLNGQYAVMVIGETGP